MTGVTRPDIPAVPAACPASTPADGIMVSCELAGDHERHRGTYVHEFAGVAADVEVSWLTGEPADAVADAAVPAVTSPAPAPAERSGTATGPAEADSDAITDLKAERDEAQSEAAMIRDHANRFLRAVYGPDVVYRAPETFSNLLERWIWAVGAGVPEIAHASIADIERAMAITGTGEEPS